MNPTHTEIFWKSAWFQEITLLNQRARALVVIKTAARNPLEKLIQEGRHELLQLQWHTWRRSWRRDAHSQDPGEACVSVPQVFTWVYSWLFFCVIVRFVCTTCFFYNNCVCMVGDVVSQIPLKICSKTVLVW